MDGGGLDVWNDLAAWQGLLDRHAHLFTPLVEGAAVGLLPRAAADASTGTMLTWVRSAAGMTSERRPFTGFGGCGVQLLFVAEPGILEHVHARLFDNPMGAMKLSVREGGMLLYVLAQKSALLDDGFEDFLETLGLAFLGACR